MEATVGGYGAVERTYHLCRRRRWVRTRKHVAKETKHEKKKVERAVVNFLLGRIISSFREFILFCFVLF